MGELLHELIEEIRRYPLRWAFFIIVMLGLYIFYYYFTPVYVYVISSPYAGSGMIKGFADAYSKHQHDIMPTRVVDFVVDDDEKSVRLFVKQIREDMLSGKRIVAIVGTDISSQTQMLLAELSKAGMHIPVISQSSSSPDLQKLYQRFFRVIYNDKLAVSTFARWYVKDGLAKPVIVVVDTQNEVWSQGVASVFNQYAQSKIIDMVRVDMSDPIKVRNLIEKILKKNHYQPDDVYVFLIDYKLANLYNILLNLSDKYRNFLVTDSVVKYMFARWLPDHLNIYLYYLPINNPVPLDVDYDYDLSFDTLNLLLNITGKGARTPDEVFRALVHTSYVGRTGYITFRYENGIYERVFDNIAILKEKEDKWHLVKLENINQ